MYSYKTVVFFGWVVCCFFPWAPSLLILPKIGCPLKFSIVLDDWMATNFKHAQGQDWTTLLVASHCGVTIKTTEFFCSLFLKVFADTLTFFIDENL